MVALYTEDDGNSSKNPAIKKQHILKLALFLDTECNSCWNIDSCFPKDDLVILQKTLVVIVSLGKTEIRTNWLSIELTD